MSWTCTLGQSDKASYRESDDIKFIYFYQTDGVVIWVYAPFFYHNKNLKDVTLSMTNFNAHIVNSYKVINFKCFKQSRSF